MAANLCEGAIDYWQLDFTRPTAIVLGAEVKGVSDFSANAADQNVILPMVGMVESYNVSVACALIFAEAQQQREEAGFYQARRLSDEAFELRFFR